MLNDGSQGWTNAQGVTVFYKKTGTYDVIVSKTGYQVEVDSVTVLSTAVAKTISMNA